MREVAQLTTVGALRGRWMTYRRRRRTDIAYMAERLDDPSATVCHASPRRTYRWQLVWRTGFMKRIPGRLPMMR
jgi:hypothetical protein